MSSIRIEPILTAHEAIRMSMDIKDKVYISEQILDYVLDIAKGIRNSAHFTVGLSTRGALALTASAKANAYFHGRDYVIPEDVKELAEYVIPHRVLFREEYGGAEKKEIIRSLIEEIPVLLS